MAAITTKQELLDYLDSKGVPAEEKSHFENMDDKRLAIFLRKYRTTELVDKFLAMKF